MLADTVITDLIDRVNLQSVPIPLLNGTSGETRFVRLITIEDDTIATNITVVGPPDAFETNRDMILFLLNWYPIGS